MEEKMSFVLPPDGMDIVQWQVMLRKQAAVTERFSVTAYDRQDEPGAYMVENSVSGRRYKVVYRGAGSMWNFCSCLDFKVNQLGTCKHMEALKLWMDNRHVETTDELPGYTAVYISYKDERQVRIRIGRECEAAFRELAGRYFDDELVLTPEGMRHFEDFLAEAETIAPSFRCFPDALRYVKDMRERERRVAMVEAECTDEALDRLLGTALYPYQKEGVRFALKTGRCMIADEMGLGKTIQAIAVAEWMLKQHLIGNVLVLCPTSLKYQWKHEIERFTGTEAQVVEGNHALRMSQYQSSCRYKIVSYNSAANDIRQTGCLKTDLLVMDEAQRLKNWNTQTARAARHIDSPYVLVLSGTPLENKLQELYSIIQFVDQYCLGPYYSFNELTTTYDENGQIIGYKNLHLVRRMLAPVLLRRRKKDVALELPPRTDKHLFVVMTKEQRRLHDDFRQQLSVLVSKWKRTHFLTERERKRVLLLLNQMRMVCDSTFILDRQTRYDTKIGELVQIIEDMIENGDEKMVVFSQWERMTRLVCQELERRRIGFVRLCGDVVASQRKELIACFTKETSCRVFVSTDAGSTGLNLQAGSVVVNLDLPWNPAVLEQRVARVYRIGQERKIQVINFIAEQSIESRMLGTLRFKSDLAMGILDEGEDMVKGNHAKFELLLGQLQEMMEQPQEVVGSVKTVLEKPAEKKELSHDDSHVIQKTEEQLHFSFGNDDEQPVPSSKQDRETSSVVLPSYQEEVGTPVSPEEQLVADGLSFINRLSEMLCSPQKTARLVDSLVKKNPQTGRMVIEIPVANKESVCRALEMLGTLLGGFERPEGRDK